MSDVSVKPKRTYSPEAYARAREVRIATQKAYYEANKEERLKYQKEYDTIRRMKLKQTRIPID